MPAADKACRGNVDTKKTCIGTKAETGLRRVMVLKKALSDSGRTFIVVV